jgi:hypothetical protein
MTMTRPPHGLRRLGALTAPVVLALCFSLASVAPAVPRSLAPLAPPAVTPPAPAPDGPAPAPTPAAPAAPAAVEPIVEAVATVAVEPPAPAPAPEPVPVPEPEPCADALASVAAAGLPLPAGVGYLCPSTRFAHQGAACWDEWPCPGSAFIAINMDLGAGATPEYLRHVVAHEICHILDFRDRGWTTEPRADACAAAYGF